MGFFLKRVAEAILIHSGVPRVARWMRRGRSVILAYHNVLPEGEEIAGDPSLHLPRKRFGEQLDRLMRTHDVVGLEELLEATSGSHVRPRAAITFDDAYHGAVTTGLHEVVRRGLPATIFVSPGLLDGEVFWWDAVASAGQLTHALRARLLDEFAGRQDRIREWLAESAGVQTCDVPASARSATAEELDRAAEWPRITFGSHSWSHPNLTRLSPAELRAELERPLRWLEDRFERVVRWLSYPYGLADTAVRRCALETGYRAALRVGGGWLPVRGADLHFLPRLNVPSGLSANGFGLRLAGLFSRR